MKRSSLTFALFGSALLSTSFIASNLNSIAKSEASLLTLKRTPANVDRFDDPHHLNMAIGNSHAIAPIDSSLPGAPSYKRPVPQMKQPIIEGTSQESEHANARARFLVEQTTIDGEAKKSTAELEAEFSGTKSTENDNEVKTEPASYTWWDRALDITGKKGAQLADQVNQLTIDIDKLTFINDKLRTDVVKANDKIINLLTKIEQLKKSGNLSDAEISEAIEELSKTKTELKDLKQQIINAAKEKDIDTKQIEQLQTEIKLANEQNAKFNEFLQELYEANGCDKIKVQNTEQELRELLANSQLVIADMTEKLGDMDKKVNEQVDKKVEEIVAKLEEEQSKKTKEELEEEHEEELTREYTSETDFYLAMMKEKRKAMKEVQRMRQLWALEDRTESQLEELMYNREEALYRQNMFVDVMRNESRFITDNQRSQYWAENGGFYNVGTPSLDQVASSYNSTFLRNAPITYKATDSYEPANYNINRHGYSWGLNPQPSIPAVLNPRNYDIRMTSGRASMIDNVDTFDMRSSFGPMV